MTKTSTLVVAAFAWMCTAPLLAQTPPVPPAVPAPPVLPVAPVPPELPLPPEPLLVMPDAFPFDLDLDFDFDFDFDAEAFRLDMDAFRTDMDAWRAELEASRPEWEALKDTFTGPFAFNLDGLQTPVAVPPAPPTPVMSIAGGRTNVEGLYDQARGYIERDQYTRALDPLDRIIAANGARADAAMYWKAYSLGKLARTPDALTTLAELQKRFPKSGWVNDARFLEAATRQASGQAVGAAAGNNDEIKLLALQGLMRTDPETAMPTIEKMLAGNANVRVKERALYLVSRSRTPRARDIILNVARSNANPDLKMAAIRSLGQMSGTENRGALVEIYNSSPDIDVKRAVLRALRSANAIDELNEIGRTEKDPELRRDVIRFMGSSNRPEAAEALRAIYNSDTTPEIRREVIRALRSNNSGGKVLVELARAEKNVELKTEMVRVMSTMNDPAVREYMLELLK